MTAPRHRSRSLRRGRVTTPGNNRRFHYHRKRPTTPICGKTGEKLSGLPLLRSGSFSRLSKSKKRINRKYGGVYSSKSVRNALKSTIWSNQ
ncbi:MAG: 50S ribosomal protein L34e [Candidatus Hodarchaeales archaeon]